MNGTRLVVFIATPLEPDVVARIRSVAPDRVEVIAEPDLWPPRRYVADHKGPESFIRTAEQEARWRRHLARAQVLWDFPPRAADGSGGMSLAPHVKWVQTTSSGVGQMVKQLGFQNSDLLVTIAKGVHAGPLAEFVFLALLTHIKRLDHLQREQRAHRWERYCTDELAGKTLAVIGAGQVGGRIAAIGRCFGMRVVASVRNASSGRATAMGVDALYPPGGLRAMLAEADVIVLIAPHTPETENMIDDASFAAMKNGVAFVNVGRGQSVDEAALIAALRSGKVAYAALDVCAVEPLPADSPLWDMPNVLISPHSASTVGRENELIAEIFCHNLRCYLDGRRAAMRNILDKARMY
jgi:phosphoglycerate dehydrogenase-like enzyme